ncbi:class I SAM-dependent methyltransferase [Microvirga sp. STS02]|uniref:class I SAM-dependent methyltransferase n=1 Tax=Hymenobacter negativus TaxID=2795026 RepID=UPI0018DDC9D6|nr:MULTISPECIES: class I SAM-dependent methyltransferase [Bacteria]MBH8568036.1 class I SAM-dependent methyltransferase [Hymenobacter negativus]MBR7207772.1 class I SAM-dependent methyltransferase [Microvirga sp. STS02]
MSTQLSNFRYFFLARIYDAALLWFYQPLVRRLVAAVNAEAGDNVLEVGVGTGISLPYYDPRKQVTAIDCSLPMLQRARKKAAEHPEVQVDLQHAAGEDFQHEAGRFEHVVFCNSLSVVESPGQLLNAYYASLRPGGHIYLLNHFTPERGPLRQLDRLLTPAGKLLGFKSFFPLSPLLAPDATVKIRHGRAGYWRIVHIQKPLSPPC